MPEQRPARTVFSLPERFGSLYLADERRWLSPPDALAGIDRAEHSQPPAAEPPAGKPLEEPANQPAENSSESMVGVWVAEKVLAGGREVPKEKFPFELHFTEDQLTYKFVGNYQGKDRVHDISIDSSKDPATINITRTVRDKKMTVYGIYKFENGKLLICSLRGEDGNPSSERPATFESSSEVTSDLLILKRKSDD